MPRQGTGGPQLIGYRDSPSRVRLPAACSWVRVVSPAAKLHLVAATPLGDAFGRHLLRLVPFTLFGVTRLDGGRS